MTIETGKPDIDLTQPSHVKGIHQGNAIGNYDKQAGWLKDGRNTAEAATGVNAEARNPIDPSMPTLPPA